MVAHLVAQKVARWAAQKVVQMARWLAAMRAAYSGTRKAGP